MNDGERGRPRLLWVNHFMVAPTEAGGTRHFEMAAALTQLGWDVTLAGSDFHLQQRAYTRRSAGDRRTTHETINGVAVRWLYSDPYQTNDWRRIRNWLSFSRQLTRERWDDAPPDVVIGSSPHLFAAWAASRVSARRKVPFIFEVRDLWPESLLAGGRGTGPGYRALGWLADRLYRKARKIVVLARGSADYLVSRGVPADRFCYVPNGVDISAFEAVSRPERSSVTLIYAGAHGPMNGLDAVLGAARELQADRRIRFLLVGDGPSKAQLMATAARDGLTNVEFRPPVPKQQIPALFAEADAGLMVLKEAPLFAFGVSPNKLFDYMASALPVVCNVPGDVAGMVASAGAGVQAVDASAGALAAAVLTLAEHTSAERAGLGFRGRAWVSREHERGALARRLDHMLRELIGR